MLTNYCISIEKDSLLTDKILHFTKMYRLSERLQSQNKFIFSNWICWNNIIKGGGTCNSRWVLFNYCFHCIDTWKWVWKDTVQCLSTLSGDIVYEIGLSQLITFQTLSWSVDILSRRRLWSDFVFNQSDITYKVRLSVVRDANIICGCHPRDGTKQTKHWHIMQVLSCQWSIRTRRGVSPGCLLWSPLPGLLLTNPGESGALSWTLNHTCLWLWHEVDLGINCLMDVKAKTSPEPCICLFDVVRLVAFSRLVCASQVLTINKLPMFCLFNSSFNLFSLLVTLSKITGWIHLRTQFPTTKSNPKDLQLNSQTGIPCMHSYGRRYSHHAGCWCLLKLDTVHYVHDLSSQ